MESQTPVETLTLATSTPVNLDFIGDSGPLHDDSLPSDTPEDRSRLWNAIETVLEANYEDPDLDAAKIAFAAVACHRITEHPPAWIISIAPSGSMKTELLNALEGLPGIHFIDELTVNTFISGKVDRPGKKRTTPASYLHRIGKDGILIVPDFSTFLSMDPRNVGKILSQMRRIYDGRFNREFGTDENLEEREWNGRLTVLAASTPEIDRHHKTFQALGDRFVRIRMPRAGGIEAAMAAMEQKGSHAGKLKSAVRDYLLPILSRKDIPAPEIPTEISERIANLGEFVALARASVPRDRYMRQIDGEVAPEGNTRLPQQLAQLSRGLALLAGRLEVGEADFALVRRAGFESMPPVRKAVLEAYIAGRSPYTIGRPAATVERAVEDLFAVGLLDEGKRVADEIHYKLSEKAQTLLAGMEAKAKTTI